MAETKVVITVPKSNSDELLALRTRVQQQSELIAMLKERADDTLRQVNKLSSENESLLKERDAMSQELTEEIKKCKSIERHFETLSDNHTKMIAIKDEFKEESEGLKRKLQKYLHNGDDPVIMEREAEIQRLQNELATVKVALVTEQATVHSQERELHHLEVELGDTKRASQETCRLLEHQLKDASTRIRELSDALKKMGEESREKEDQNCHAMSLLQSELNTERINNKDKELELDRLEEVVATLRKNVSELKEQLRHKEEEITLNSASVELIQVKQEYDAYKTHMTAQLEQERQLNKKLQKLLNY